MLVFVGFYVAIAGILCREIVESELIIKGAVYLPVIGIYTLGIDRFEIKSRTSSLVIMKDELDEYYRTFHGQRQVEWKDKLGDDLNWALSFDNLPEKETTKHVHRLHPYKGKFIPQLVEYFLDGHTDEFKDKLTRALACTEKRFRIE